MAVFAPVKLPPELKSEIRNLAEELDVKVAAVPGQEAPDLGSSEPLRLVPQVQIKSSYHAAAHRNNEKSREKLRIQAVSAYRSMWDERFPQNWIDEDDQGREDKLQKEQAEREENHADRLKERERLPIFEAKNRVLTTIRRARVTLVAADTGSGKSTQVPQFILDEAIAQGCGRQVHVVCTQPRRLAAVSLASRVAWERGERSDGHGSTGHVVRWEEKPPRPWGSICFCTVGSLLPRISRLGASHVIVDEAHTRDIHTDLLLTVLLELLKNSTDLKVIVMSATLDVSKWQGHFQNFHCELVRAGGRPYDVRRYFLEDIVEDLRWQPESGGQPEVQGVWSELDCNRGFLDPEGRYSPSTLLTVRSLPESIVHFQLISSVLKWVDSWGIPGGVLIFLPGWHEIASCMSRLQRDPALRRYEFVPLHSTVPPNEQYRAFHPAAAGGRKAILSTDIAETSITIPDIICVVDSGLARVKKHTNLEVVWASQANFLQRAGRAGRVQHGVCVHLFTRSRFYMLAPEPTPEMQRVPLDEALLSVCDLGLDDCTDIPEEDVEAYGPCCYVMNFLKQAPDPPLSKDVWNAFKELQHVGALDRAGFLTHLGALLVRLPMSPGLGSAFYFASLLGFPEAASQVAASLDGREPFSRQKNEDASSAMNFAEGVDQKKRWSDVFAMAKALGEFESQSSRDAPRFCREKGLIYPVMQQLSSAMQQLKRVSWDLSKACLYWTPGVAPDADDGSGNADAWEGDGAATVWEDEGQDDAGCDCASGARIFPKDTLEDSWPIMQTMLTLAYSWNIGSLEGGRRVNAGWAKASRLHRTSVLVDDDDKPPCALLTYVELTNSGGRILRGGTTVTPQQLLFCGGRGGAFWQNDTAVLEKWLEIEADFESAALLAALRTCNSLVLHKAAELSLQDFRGQWIDWASRQSLLDLIEKWRRCVIQVAFLPLPEKISVWDMDFSRISPRTPAIAASSNQLAEEQLAPAMPPLPAPAAFPVAPVMEEASDRHTTRWQHRTAAPRTMPVDPWQSTSQQTSMPPQQWHSPAPEPQPGWIPCGSTLAGAAQPNMSPDTHRTSMPPQQWHSPTPEPQPGWIPCGSTHAGAAQPINMSPDTHRTSMPPQQWQSPAPEPQPSWIPCGSTRAGAAQSTMSPDTHRTSMPPQQWQSPAPEPQPSWDTDYSNRPAQWRNGLRQETPQPDVPYHGSNGDTGSSWWD